MPFTISWQQGIVKDGKLFKKEPKARHITTRVFFQEANRTFCNLAVVINDIPQAIEPTEVNVKTVTDAKVNAI